MAKVKSFGERIADALVEDGLLTPQQVEALLEEQKRGGTRLVKLIVEKSYVSEQDLTVSMGRVLNVPSVNLGRLTIPAEISDLLPAGRRAQLQGGSHFTAGKQVVPGDGRPVECARPRRRQASDAT